MSRLVESIKLDDGRFYNLPRHEQRMASSLLAVYGVDRSPDLSHYLSEIDHPRKGLFKCRIVYDDKSMQATFTAYEAKQIRRVKVVEDNLIAYAFKFSDRTVINRLFSLRGECDDVLIVRHGMVTDCSFSNVVFRKGAEWFTPDTPLLKGTMRQKLIEENKIMVREIPVTEIRSFETFKIVNAMLEFDGPEIEVSDIVF